MPGDRRVCARETRSGEARLTVRALAVLVSALPAAAFAQDADIVVTGALPDPMSDRAYDIVVIEADRLTGTASNRVEDALRDVAGLQQFRRTDARSANATSQGATLRGLGGNASSRALLVLDGVPQSDPFGGWVTWPAFAPERLGRIVVTRGGGSGAYGSGALSGTIEMESIAGGGGLGGGLAYGSRDGIEANALLSGKLGAGFGFISANYARGDGFVPIVAAQRGPADIPAPYEEASLAARGVAPLSARTELQASMLAFTDRRTRGTILSGNGGDGADASVRIVHRGDWAWQALAYVQTRKFQSRFVAVNAARDTVTQTVDQFNVPSTGLGARFEMRPPVGDAVELRLGGDWRRTRGETNERFTYVAGQPTRIREAGGSADTLGGFAELSGGLGAFTLTGSARIDHWRLGDGRLIERTIATGALLRNELSVARSGWEPTARAGLSWEEGRVSLRAAAYLGWRLPTLNELYRPFRVGADATAANPALAPERMKGVEAGIDWRPADGLSLRTTAFANRLTDAIANVTLGAGPGVFPGVGFVAAGGAYRQRLNVDAIRSNGIELDATMQQGNWRASLSYALSDARVRASGRAAALDGLRPAQVPRHLASATIGWRWISATLRHVSGQFEDDGNTRRLGDAVTLDAVANLPLSDRLSLLLRAENLTDTRVEAAISGAGVIERATPRTLWAGLRWRP
jgi:outer membrane receptor protein involved in Fe transport